ncbi:putative L-lactate dehydrogenase operon regulatory protein [Streptococcus equi subsp. zooepidemicus MGCS10565]|uniref:L-lactate dehydrogenase operon regulatory protein n=1 Tax=Streptococcus equi subsp. zooepidemicus (strain MGCS10565) TaxID=552526 RepID=B4U235_STREM|nr:FadR/GntR family transcriptional regulator [Streptococcus equi]ACG62052.1 putative L-lactate dehydrogenase operon regulatory protein [Streptococcus equi subsp. zooepidemicus MGCS10565]MDI6035947.1 FadR/GntR family transcriptional regulator [Streptococcus equi subsp. zooepidemicus]QZA21623.1 FadR family transcriptional regulator [Streptococcus equi subsp. zooepidemicus]SQF53751.1 GntR family regulatory protein [Streptococcus equi subsp. zooepidemicus]HEL0096078.1 FadR family transcriptional 
MARPLVEKTAERLLKLILERGYEVGAKLPNEYELAQDLEVGRSTIREAVRSLATRNVLEVRQGSGTYISSKKGVSEDPLGFSLVKDTAKLTADLFELRLLLEPRIAALTAQHATPKEVEALEKLVIDIEEAVAAGDPKHLQLDVNFHSLMAKYSGNIAMDSLLPVINQSIHLINANYTNRQMKEDSLQAHRDILNAIKAGDPVAAHDAMLLHIMTVKRTAFLS